MLTLLIFALALFAAALVSDLAHRTPLSTAALFLGVGVLCGPAGLGIVQVDTGHHLVKELAVVALVAVLFSDGMRLPVPELRRTWALPGRALLVGLPLTLGITAVLARLVAGLPWADALLLGAVLSATDPVFASGIVGRSEVPARLRRMLSVESGLNDGLALPLVVALLALDGGRHDLAGLALDLIAGVAIGVAVPLAAARVERLRVFAVSADHEALVAVAVVLAVVSACEVTGANELLGAFAAGVTMASVRPAWRTTFHRVGEPVTEALKLGAVLVFGAVLSPSILTTIGWRGWAFVSLALLFARPVAIHLALVRSRLSRPEVAIAAWFGPKGFASVVFGLQVLDHGAPGATHIFALAAAAVAVSILAHGSTDVPIARWYGRRHCEMSTR